MRIAYVDASGGASEDMLLAALLGAGASLAAVQSAFGALQAASPDIAISVAVEAAGTDDAAASRVQLSAHRPITVRSWPEVADVIAGAELDDEVRDTALAAFYSFAQFDSAAHGIDLSEVEFAATAALDAIGGIVGFCAALRSLEISELICSPLADGTCSPAALALLTALATQWGSQPEMTVLGTGAGAAHPGSARSGALVRIFVGD